ncbi:MAG: hypothetical protein QHH75_12690 [Bacillota bacterium]|nr:hypothetical protein [Bacillota bacterium]
MASAFYDERAFQVIQSFRPYLGPLGSGYVSALESLLELISSEPAQKTRHVFRLFGFGEEFQMLADKSSPDVNPFTLFLILILLVLADLPGSKKLFAEFEEEAAIQIPQATEPELPS